jgi:hypothetical protein
MLLIFTKIITVNKIIASIWNAALRFLYSEFVKSPPRICPLCKLQNLRLSTKEIFKKPRLTIFFFTHADRDLKQKILQVSKDLLTSVREHRVRLNCIAFRQT